MLLVNIRKGGGQADGGPVAWFVLNTLVANTCCMPMGHGHVSRLSVHAACHAVCPYCFFLPLVHRIGPFCMSILYANAARSFRTPRRHTYASCLRFMSLWCMSILQVHAACPCCLSMLHVHAACPCCMFMLLVHAACLCCLSMLLVQAACPCCLTMLTLWPHVCVACPCFMTMSPHCMSMLREHEP
jgi:hypothetical protein